MSQSNGPGGSFSGGPGIPGANVSSRFQPYILAPDSSSAFACFGTWEAGSPTCRKLDECDDPYDGCSQAIECRNFTLERHPPTSRFSLKRTDSRLEIPKFKDFIGEYSHYFMEISANQITIYPRNAAPGEEDNKDLTQVAKNKRAFINNNLLIKAGLDLTRELEFVRTPESLTLRQAGAMFKVEARSPRAAEVDSEQRLARIKEGLLKKVSSDIHNRDTDSDEDELDIDIDLDEDDDDIIDDDDDMIEDEPGLEEEDELGAPALEEEIDLGVDDDFPLGDDDDFEGEEEGGAEGEDEEAPAAEASAVKPKLEKKPKAEASAKPRSDKKPALPIDLIPIDPEDEDFLAEEEAEPEPTWNAGDDDEEPEDKVDDYSYDDTSFDDDDDDDEDDDDDDDKPKSKSKAKAAAKPAAKAKDSKPAKGTKTPAQTDLFDLDEDDEDEKPKTKAKAAAKSKEASKAAEKAKPAAKAKTTKKA